MIDPLTRARAVTPDNDNDLPFGQARGLYVGVSGDVVVIAENDTDAQTYKSVPIGWFPVRTKRVKATGTTATNIIAVYS